MLDLSLGMGRTLILVTHFMITKCTAIVKKKHVDSEMSLDTLMSRYKL